MQLHLIFIVITIILTCITISPVLPQRNFPPQQDFQYCITPENYYGTCVTLAYCHQMTRFLQMHKYNPWQTQKYVRQSKTACGNQNVNGDPIICCSKAESQSTSRFQRQTQHQVTQRSILFPTETPLPIKPQSTSTIISSTSCISPDGLKGTCKALKQCPLLANILVTKQKDPEFINYLRGSHTICGGETTTTTVCCPSITKTLKPVTSRPLIRNTNEIPKRLPTVEEGCGYTTRAHKKIVGGEVSQKGSWPWIALIGYDDELSETPFKCGGALITARHVLTAAHCIRRDLLYVRLGEHDLSSENETHIVDIKVVRSEKHPDYTVSNGHSDIAILYLERNVEFTELISPICLPTTPELRNKSYVKYSPFVAGWGKTMEGGDSAKVLQELQIPIYNNAICRDRYEKQKRLFSENQFDAAVLCAGVLTGGKDVCRGDSGGPLMLPEPYEKGIRFYQIGVVAYGVGCARPDLPSVYTSTQYFMDWIIQKVADTQ